MKKSLPLYTTKLVRTGSVALGEIRSPRSVFLAFAKLLGDLPNEAIGVLWVGRNMTPKGAEIVAIGGEGYACFSPGAILRPVILSGSHHFFVAHNHPSGDARPSFEDYKTTRYLIRASTMMGFRLLDHLIFTATGEETPSFSSLRDDIGHESWDKIEKDAVDWRDK